MNLKYITINIFHLLLVQNKNLKNVWSDAEALGNLIWNLWASKQKNQGEVTHSASKFLRACVWTTLLVLAQAELQLKSAMKHLSSFQLNDIYNCAFSPTSVAGLPEHCEYSVMPSRFDK